MVKIKCVFFYYFSKLDFYDIKYFYNFKSNVLIYPKNALITGVKTIGPS